MADHEDLIKQFRDTTGCSSDRANFYLECVGWELGPALGMYFDSDQSPGQDVNMEDFSGAASPQSPTPVGGGGGLIERARQAAGYVFPGINPTAPPGSSDPAPTSGPAASKPKVPTGGSGSSRIATFSSIRGREEESDDDSDDPEHGKPRGQEFYVGSGQEVIGPGKKRTPNEIISSIFSSARQHGAEQVEDEPQQPGRPQAFSGAGMRLDSAGPSGSSSAPQNLSGAQRPPDAAVPSTPTALRMWRNGFTINDGPLRLYTDPANQEFMEYVKQGRVPRELVLAARGSDLKIQLEDHREEEYRAPKEAPTYFGGTGHLLGSPSPAVVTANSIPAKKPESADARQVSEEKAKSAYAVSDGTPTTNIQIRLLDGSRLVHRFGEEATVGDIRRFIRLARPELEGSTFQMLAGFPSKPLESDSVSLRDASLLNAAIQLK